MKKGPVGKGGCEEILGSLDSYMSNELDELTGRKVADHLAACSSCSGDWDARQKLRTRLKAAVERQAVPPELPARIRGRIDAYQSRSWVNTGWGRWSIAAAAAACLAIAATTVLHKNQLPLPDLADRAGQQSYIQKVSATVAGALKLGLGDHLHCSIFRKYPANPPTAVEMASKLGPEYEGLLPLVKAAVPADYRVIMAHQCGFAGRKYVHLTLQNGKDLVSLVIARKQPGESLGGLSEQKRAAGVPVYQTDSGGYEVAGFEAGEYMAFVVSELRGRTNLNLALNLAPAVHQFLTKNPA